MRLNLLLTCFTLLVFFGCSESDDPNVSIVETLEVTRSSASSRTFRGNIQRIIDNDTILAYGFEWESRYGNWQTKRHGKINKGKFVMNDTTRLSKWTTFSVRAFIETTRGVTYGNAVKFETGGD